MNMTKVKSKEMSKEEIEKLLIRRLKCIADYPGMDVQVGFIIPEDSTTYNFHYRKQFPHLYKELEWWEERKPEELPQYVVYGDAVIKVLSWSNFNGGTFYYKGKTPMASAFAPCKWATPATLSEYESYINSQNKG